MVQPLTGICFYVLHVIGVHPFEMPLFVIGGYYCDDDYMILYRDIADGILPHRDSILEVLPNTTLRVGNHDDGKYLLDTDWDRFAMLDDDAQFRLGGRVWTKMATADLSALMGNRVFLTE